MKGFAVILDKTLLESRNNSIDLWTKVHPGLRKVYLFSFEKKIDGKFINFLKIGKTDYLEAWDSDREI